MSELRITRTETGVARVTTADPFDSLEILRIERACWKATPQSPGVYLLYGFPEGLPTAYIGMSETDMRARMKSHHEKKGDWFGVLFVISLPNAVLSRAIEAQLIALAQESGVVGLTNKASENHYAETELAEIPPAIAKITGALEMLLGNDIFTSVDSDEPEVLTTKPEHLPKLARVYRGSAETPRDRGPGDPASATHAYVVPASLKSWGSFEGDEPNKAFRVLAGSSWRPAVPVGGPSTVASQLYQVSIQQGLIEAGVLDPETKTFNVAHVFENWTRAARCVSGIGTYSGSYRWQRLAS